MDSHPELYWSSVVCAVVSGAYILCTFLYYLRRPEEETGWVSKTVLVLAIAVLYLSIFVCLGIQGTAEHIRRTSATSTRSTER